MVRSFMQRKLLPKNPIRFCTKKTGPRESSLINIAKIGRNQLRKKIITSEEINTSTNRLIDKYRMRCFREVFISCSVLSERSDLKTKWFSLVMADMGNVGF
jgi:hypothetical protein